MAPRYPSRPTSSSFAYSFGPGPMTQAVKALILANIVMFVATWVSPSIDLVGLFGLRPRNVFGLEVWRLVTYMFLHGGIFHILFNMLALWMFGVELERMWGSRYFTEVLLRMRRGRSHHDAGPLPAAAPCVQQPVRCAHRWGVGRRLRHSPRVRPLLSERPDHPLLRVPGPRSVRRDDHGRDLAPLLDGDGRWRRPRRPPRRTHCGLPVPERRPRCTHYPSFSTDS